MHLGDLMAERVASFDPKREPSKRFELWSIPAFDSGRPEVVIGSDVGSPKKCLEPGDVLLSKIVPHIRRAWVVAPDSGLTKVGSGEWIVFRGKGFDPGYLKNFLISDDFHSKFMGTIAGVGGSLMRARPDAVRQFEIPLPPLDEQRRIAAILDQVDALRRKRNEALVRLDALVRATFINFFGNPVSNSSGWPIHLLGNVGTLDRGVSKHRPRNDPALLGGRYPLIQTGDVANSGGNIRSYSSTYSDLGLRQSRLWPTGTLCITIAANIGKTGILGFDACFPDSIVGFSPGPTVLVSYVKEWFSFIQKKLEDDAPESAQKNINLDILRRLALPIPPMRIQRKFEAAVLQIDRLRSQNRQDWSHFDALFASLQHRAFSGKLTRSAVRELGPV